MKKSTKIFNTEVIERLALSDNIPPFDRAKKWYSGHHDRGWQKDGDI